VKEEYGQGVGGTLYSIYNIFNRSFESSQGQGFGGKKQADINTEKKISRIFYSLDIKGRTLLRKHPHQWMS
jgi:hypothetical protein